MTTISPTQKLVTLINVFTVEPANQERLLDLLRYSPIAEEPIVLGPRSCRHSEVMPGPLKGKELERFIRNAAGTYFRETCTCKMGRDNMSVVDGKLKVYGLEGLRIADGSVMPTITTGNTMAPCVIIGERCAQELKKQYRI
jgi:choline dehydrogenase-like flavoprotein